jgi:hypothetical protein
MLALLSENAYEQISTKISPSPFGKEDDEQKTKVPLALG